MSDAHRAAKEIFSAAVQLEPERRHRFVAERCAADPDLEREVLDLLRYHHDSIDCRAMALRDLRDVPPAAVAAALAALRALGEDAPIAAWWDALPRTAWPGLFRLLDIGADLPRLAGNRTLGELAAEQWPALAEVTADLLRAQRLVDEPIVPPGAEAVTALALPDELDAAAARLEDHHCVTVDGLLDGAGRAELDAAVEALRGTRGGAWGELEHADAPALFAVMERLLGGPAFHRLTGFDLDRDDYSLTLSLQSLEPAGIGWHRDLYWPREWVGRDVFAVFYALGDDGPQKGGAFVYYLPWQDRVCHFYRRRHQATVLWNSAEPAGRILHAVAGYHDAADTERHLIILQCLRR